ncbi:uncharacterized protein LOC106059978 [Biomphalaria glabrata]|uniref:Uncharacterized protein LOC106059978 n=1 Tax=Biomphalaria glabrata TaxID=6526 RepID=A0A9W3BI23_BIOGL|nr:uncharacterized protein LOC106059978 [Biomphalaria glabrata]XP_055899084.1 uncharacterized protein LOC106059978 [Biomphalaria glabrata]KAI8780859.1 hypothetical protein BgiBS90_018210 [Biomphalaria glabrata]
MCSQVTVFLEREEIFVPLALHQYLGDVNQENNDEQKGDKQIELLTVPSGISCQSAMDVVKTPLNTIACENASDHSKFKDMKTLSLNDLPKTYQNDDILALIKSVAELAVVVHVPVSKQAGLYWQGTGKVEEVFIFKENTQCRCMKCKASGNPSKEWGKVMIATSTKLLTARKYVTEIKCTLFHDSEEGEATLAYLNGDAYTSNEWGVCKFFCYTCDMDLLNKLDAYLDVFEDKWIIAFAKYYKTIKSAEEKFLVMICHPHACKKHVSIGTWSKLRPFVTFDAATCPGCEGSFLVIPCFDVDEDDFS